MYVVNFTALCKVECFLVCSKIKLFSCRSQLAVRSAAARLLEIAGSNPAEVVDVRLLCLLCVVQVAGFATGRSLAQGSPNKLCVCLSDGV
jgi:hypothetical protein